MPHAATGRFGHAEPQVVSYPARRQRRCGPRASVVRPNILICFPAGTGSVPVFRFPEQLQIATYRLANYRSCIGCIWSTNVTARRPGAGFTGAVIVLPQGVAFATIALPAAEYGLYTAMVTPVIAALFGSSFHLVSADDRDFHRGLSAIGDHATPGRRSL